MPNQTEPTKPEDVTPEEWLALCRRDVEELVASLKGMNAQLAAMPADTQGAVRMCTLRLQAMLSLWGQPGSAALVLVGTTLLLEEANARLVSATMAMQPTNPAAQTGGYTGPLH